MPLAARSNGTVRLPLPLVETIVPTTLYFQAFYWPGAGPLPLVSTHGLRVEVDR